MKIKPLLLCAVLSAMLGALNLAAETTDVILARMNEVAVSFKGMSANVSMTTYTKVIDDKEIETGTLKMQRIPGKGTRALLSLSGDSDSHIVFLAENVVRLYTPKAKLVKDYPVAKSSDLVEQYLMLGFGSSGTQLTQNYEVNNAGTEKISGLETTHLVLLPRSNQVKEKIAKVDVWIPIGKAYPAQEQFLEPNGNYRITTYSDVVINPPMKGSLEFKVPPGTKKE